MWQSNLPEAAAARHAVPRNESASRLGAPSAAGIGMCLRESFVAAKASPCHAKAAACRITAQHRWRGHRHHRQRMAAWLAGVRQKAV